LLVEEIACPFIVEVDNTIIANVIILISFILNVK
jgi:hypothetical protein